MIARTADLYRKCGRSPNNRTRLKTVKELADTEEPSSEHLTYLVQVGTRARRPNWFEQLSLRNSPDWDHPPASQRNHHANSSHNYPPHRSPRRLLHVPARSRDRRFPGPDRQLCRHRCALPGSRCLNCRRLLRQRSALIPRPILSTFFCRKGGKPRTPWRASAVCPPQVAALQVAV